MEERVYEFDAADIVWSLEVRGKSYMLYRKEPGREDSDECVGLNHQRFLLLEFLLQRYQQYVSYSQLAHIFKTQDVENVITVSLSVIRQSLEFPKGLPDIFQNDKVARRVRFELSVNQYGDTGNDVVHPRWQDSRLDDFLKNTATPYDSSDKRIPMICLSTVGFDTKLIQKFRDADDSRRHMDYKILLLNPWNQELLNGRFSLRNDFGPDAAKKQLVDQIEALSKIAKSFDSERERIHNDIVRRRLGRLEFRLSNHFPCGFLSLSRRGALLGLFSAVESHVDAPQIESPPRSNLWNFLAKDWLERWNVATQPSDSIQCRAHLESIGMECPSKQPAIEKATFVELLAMGKNK